MYIYICIYTHLELPDRELVEVPLCRRLLLRRRRLFVRHPRPNRRAAEPNAALGARTRSDRSSSSRRGGRRVRGGAPSGIRIGTPPGIGPFSAGREGEEIGSGVGASGRLCCGGGGCALFGDKVFRRGKRMIIIG